MKTPLTPEEFLDLIDEFYTDAVLEGVSRFEPKWGIWSRQMNLEINQRAKVGDPESAKLKYVTVYWILKSQVLEFHYKKPLFYTVFVKKLEAEANTIKELIVSDANVKPVSIEDLAALILGSNQLESMGGSDGKEANKKMRGVNRKSGKRDRKSKRGNRKKW